jgi:DNA processing protein
MTAAATRDALALSFLPGVGATEFHRRIAAAGSASAALERADRAAVHGARDRADEALARGVRCGALCVAVGESGYPSALQALPVAPPVVWMRGRPGFAAVRQVAIVGTRAASTSGERVARQLATVCAEAGIGVVSGLALGIDGAAHAGALEAAGVTVAVLGTGVDVPYPPRHRALHERIGAEGLLLSEVPPGERGHAGTFPQRNRLIAALGEVTVVVEAGHDSGALITARVADDLGRTVCAVPGSILAPACAGSNALLQQGATMLCSPDDLLAELGVARERPTAPRLEGDAASCWDALRAGAVDVAALAERAGLDVRRVAVALAALEIHGLVEVDAAGCVRPLVVVG